MPAAVARDQPAGFRRSPRIRIIWVEWRRRAQHQINHSPGRLDRILAREERCVAVERIAEQPLIRLHLAAVVVARHQLDMLTYHRFTWYFGPRANRKHDIRAEAKAEVVRLRRLHFS